MTKEELIEEAERRYPVGTQFYPSENAKEYDQYCIITEDSHFEVRYGCIVYSVVDNKYYSKDPKYGNTDNRMVYLGITKEWAEIRKDYKEIAKELLKKLEEIVSWSNNRFTRSGETIKLIKKAHEAGL